MIFFFGNKNYIINEKNIYVCIMCVLFVYEIVYIDMFLKILEILVIVFGF